ncbi:MAG: hypothetical protein WCO33_00715 [bacterium]
MIKITNNKIVNNKAQSLVSIMLFVMVLGIIVTLIIASSITDTKRLVSQKSYERAYSLSDSYMSKILSYTGEVFGASTTGEGLNSIPGILEAGNTNLSCQYTEGQALDATVISNLYNKVTFQCSYAGQNQDSQVTCTQMPVGYGLSMAGVKDKKMKINLTGVEVGASSPKLAFLFNNSDALLFNFVYTKVAGNGKTIYQNYMFGVKDNSATGYTGMVAINTTGATQVITYPTGSIIDSSVVKVYNSSSDVADAGIRAAFNGSAEDNSPAFLLDIDALANKVYTSEAVSGGLMKSLTVSFLNKEYTNAKYSIAQIDFPTNNHLDTQFQRTSCKTLDAAVISGTTLTSGFGAAELETYRPINKTVAGILDYSLFIGRENPDGSTTPIPEGYGASLNK